MKTWMPISHLIASALLLSACAPAGGDSKLDDINAENDSIYANSSTLWPNHSIPVCWENGSDGDATQRAWVQEQVTKTWDAVSSIDFTGWGACDAASSGIRIFIDDSGPHTKGLGTQINGVAQGMVLNFTFKSWSPACQGQEEWCIRSIAVHEFGHALGFAHEQNRKDSPSTCTQEPQGGDGDFVIGAWDLSSVMNYCNPQYNGNGNLSQTDIDAIRLVYDAGITGIIVNEHDDKCLDVSGGSNDDGAAVIAWPCHGGDNQRWDLAPQGGGYYTITNRQSGKCLDVTGASRDNGAGVEQWSCNGGENQAWLVESTGGVTRLISKGSGKCLDLADFSQADGARIQQWDCSANDNQQWSPKR